MLKYYVFHRLKLKSCSCMLAFSLIAASSASAQLSHSVSFQKSELEIRSLRTEEAKEEFQKLVMKSLPFTGEAGKPELPVKYVRLLIPAETEVAGLAISASEACTIKLERKLYPAQSPTATSVNFIRHITKADSAFYNSYNTYPPEPVKVVDDGYFDGNHIVTLAVFPLQYSPKKNKAIFHSLVNFSLLLKPGKSKCSYAAERPEENQIIYDNILKGLIDNPEDIIKYQVKPRLIKLSHSPPERNVMDVKETLPFYEYAIITTDELKAGFEEFINWKRRKGLSTGVVTIDQIKRSYKGDLTSGLFDDAGKLRQYLKDAYLSGLTLYALLAGGKEAIPFRYGTGTFDALNYNAADENNKIPADLYFSDFNGNWNVDKDNSIGEPVVTRGYMGWEGDSVDYYPEIFVGRILCRSLEEVLSWSEKVIGYEQHPFDGNFNALKKALWSQSDEMQQNRHAQGVAANFPSFTHTYIEEEPGYRDSQPSFPTGTYVISKINEGFGFYNIYNHGEARDYVVRWPSIHDTKGDKAGYCSAIYGRKTAVQTDYNFASAGFLDNISNQNKYTIIYSISCDPASYDNTGVPDRCIADEYTVLNESGGPAFLGNTRSGWLGCSDLLHKEFITALFSLNLYHIGQAEAVSKSFYNSDYHHYLALSHNLFGDPEMPVWTDGPFTFDGITVKENGDSSAVTVSTGGVTDADICLCSTDNGLSYFERVSGAGSHTFSTSVRPLYITVTRQNYIPYITTEGLPLVNNKTRAEKPEGYSLMGSYPNPFNPSTVIRYEVPSLSKVELKVYDILGKEVMTLQNGIQEAGRYSACFNASGLPSGIYIYFFKAHSLENGKSFRKSSKMLFLK